MVNQFDYISWTNDELQQQRPQSNLSVVLVLGHMNIEGNEQADIEAKMRRIARDKLGHAILTRLSMNSWRNKVVHNDSEIKWMKELASTKENFTTTTRNMERPIVQSRLQLYHNIPKKRTVNTRSVTRQTKSCTLYVHQFRIDTQLVHMEMEMKQVRTFFRCGIDENQFTRNLKIGKILASALSGYACHRFICMQEQL